jgi:hypothetical protein
LGCLRAATGAGWGARAGAAAIPQVDPLLPGHPPRSPGSLGPFLAKLAAKNQSVVEREQAARAVRLLIGPSPQPRPGGSTPPTAGQGGGAPTQGNNTPVPLPSGVAQPPTATALAPPGGPPRNPALPLRPQFEARTEPPRALPAPVQVPGRGASWQREYDDLKAAILVRNYSTRTLEAYRFWVAKFQTFVRSRPTAELETQEVRGFLSELAVRHRVAASGAVK